MQEVEALENLNINNYKVRGYVQIGHQQHKLLQSCIIL